MEIGECPASVGGQRNGLSLLPVSLRQKIVWRNRGGKRMGPEAWIFQLWGSPIGIAVFLAGMGLGMGLFFWGISRLAHANVAKAELQFRERQYNDERRERKTAS
jgi:hypothetical protein